jgi:hypothetical protein
LLFEDYKESYDFLFQRALLTFGDYTVSSGSTKSFCTFEESLRYKNDNWRKLFNDQKINIYLKNLLDTINISNIAGSLKNCIDNYNCSENDWKSFFIKNSAVLKFCDNRQIRINGEIITLSKSNSSGLIRRAELYSYVYYQRYLEKNDAQMNPFTHTRYFVHAYEYPCTVIDEWYYKEHNFAINISYHDNFCWTIKFFDRNEIAMPDKIITVLTEQQFNVVENELELRKSKMQFSELDTTIHEILKSLAGIAI